MFKVLLDSYLSGLDVAVNERVPLKVPRLNGTTVSGYAIACPGKMTTDSGPLRNGKSDST